MQHVLQSPRMGGERGMNIIEMSILGAADYQVPFHTVLVAWHQNPPERLDNKFAIYFSI
jgi:hypothetical protein